MPRIIPNLWFDSESLEAAEFYVSVFPNSEVTTVTRYGDSGPGKAGDVMSVDFVLDGQEVTAINGGPIFKLDEAFSLAVMCKDQAEVDHYWDRLLEGGGEESMCGWLKDRFGLSWQVVPADWADILTGPDRARADRAMAAMLTMRKVDIAAIEAAADGA
jgi:predicted 3-demethylubiquinone-9 3-methyltransferase (glyoxalase superfamily)